MEGTYIAGPKRRRVGEPVTIGVAATAWLTSPAGQAAVGNFVQGIIDDIFGRRPSRWDNAGAGVHDWFTPYGEEAYLVWLTAKHPNAFGSLDSVKAFRYLWTMIGAPGNQPPIAPGFFRQIYDPNYRLPTDAAMNNLAAAMGIDLPASIIKHTQNGYPNTPQALNTLNPDLLVYIPGFGQQVDDRLNVVLDDIASGKPLDDDAADVAEGFYEEEQDQDRSDTMTTVAVAAAGLLLPKLIT